MNIKKTYIIAECAQGFEGNYNYANLLVKAASAANADAVKFQLIYADELATPDYKYYDLFKKLEMSDDDWLNISLLANRLNIHLQLDIFGEKSLALAEKLNVDAIKIHGTDIANKRLLLLVASSRINKIILGVGGALQSEIKIALKILGDKDIILMFGFQSYPTLINDNNLSRIKVASDIFQPQYSSLKFGFADHADPETNLHLGIATLAIGMGASVLEKHLTISKSIKMEDYESALNPDDFLQYVNFIRNCDDVIGDASYTDDFGMSQSELQYRKNIRRHIVTINSVSKGDLLKLDNLVLKRTSSETALTDLNDIEDKVVSISIKANYPVNRDSVV